MYDFLQELSTILHTRQTELERCRLESVSIPQFLYSITDIVVLSYPQSSQNVQTLLNLLGDSAGVHVRYSKVFLALDYFHREKPLMLCGKFDVFL